MWVVPPRLVDTILTHYNQTFALPTVSEGACAAVIGKIRTDGMYVVNYQGKQLVHARAQDVTRGIVYDRPFVSKREGFIEINDTLVKNDKVPSEPSAILLALLAHENIASRAPIFEMYDKQVQGRTIIEAGWADAGVMQPFNEDKYPEEVRQTGIALSLDHNPRYNKIDAYWGAVNAVVESVRNVVAVGAFPVALTDCLCFGNPEQPEQMGEFVDSVQGIMDACQAVKLKNHSEATLPVIAGNVSFYNDSAQGAIPPSPMISCLGAMPEVSKAITYAFKQANSIIMMVGERKDECGGSVYYHLHQFLGSQLPKPDLSTFSSEIHAVQAAIQQGLVLAAHDISEGGVAVALAEMSFKYKIGVKVEIEGKLPIEKRLFSESGGFVLEVARDKVKAIKAMFAEYNVPLEAIGETIRTANLLLNGVIDLPVDDAKRVWENGLRGKLL